MRSSSSRWHDPLTYSVLTLKCLGLFLPDIGGSAKFKRWVTLPCGRPFNLSFTGWYLRRSTYVPNLVREIGRVFNFEKVVT